MRGQFRLLTVFCIPLLLLAVATTASDRPGPSEGAQGMDGATGTIEFKPDDWQGMGSVSHWFDSDGIAPEVAGCHVGTDSEGTPNGRKFGEACLSDGRLVESNPAADVIHEHADDIGHPDTFDCNAWCGTKSGVCEETQGPAPCARSARCICR